MNVIRLSTSLLFASVVVGIAGASTGHFRLNENALRGQSIFKWQDIDELLAIDQNADGVLTDAELKASLPLLVEFGEMLYTVRQADVSASLPRASVALSREGEIVFDLTFRLPGETSTVELELEFAGAADFPLTHQHAFHVTDSDGNVIVDEVSDRSGERQLFPEPKTLSEVVSAVMRTSQTKSLTPATMPAAIDTSPVTGSAVAVGPARSLTGIWIGLALAVGWFGHLLISKNRRRR